MDIDDSDEDDDDAATYGAIARAYQCEFACSPSQHIPVFTFLVIIFKFYFRPKPPSCY